MFTSGNSKRTCLLSCLPLRCYSITQKCTTLGHTGSHTIRKFAPRQNCYRICHTYSLFKFQCWPSLEIRFLPQHASLLTRTTITMASTTPVEGPLYAYTLPSGLLDHLEQRDGASTATASDESKDLHSSRPSDQEVSTSLGCSLCKVPSFHSVANQRQHFKSDWHKYNLHLSTAKRTAAPLTEEQFDAQAEADGAPISSYYNLSGARF